MLFSFISNGAFFELKSVYSKRIRMKAGAGHYTEIQKACHTN